MIAFPNVFPVETSPNFCGKIGGFGGRTGGDCVVI